MKNKAASLFFLAAGLSFVAAFFSLMDWDGPSVLSAVAGLIGLMGVYCSIEDKR